MPLLLILLLGVTLWAQVPAPTGRRAALLVGVNRYETLPPVPASPPNLAGMAEALRQSGFADLQVVNDPSLSEFQTARDKFLETVRPGDSIFI